MGGKGQRNFIFIFIIVSYTDGWSTHSETEIKEVVESKEKKLIISSEWESTNVIGSEG